MTRMFSCRSIPTIGSRCFDEFVFVDGEMMNIAILGYGKMGHLVEEVAKHKGISVPVIIDAENEGGREITAEKLSGVDVCVDFSMPKAVVDNIKACAAIFLSMSKRNFRARPTLSRTNAILRNSPHCRRRWTLLAQHTRSGAIGWYERRLNLKSEATIVSTTQDARI